MKPIYERGARAILMIKVCILYPRSQDGRFDIEYYVNKHMPMSIGLLRDHPGFKGVSVESGLTGEYPQTRGPRNAGAGAVWGAV